jgi:hypothetical protein
MKFKLLFCLALSGLCFNVAAKHSHCSHCDQKITTSAAHHSQASIGNQTQNSSSHSDTEVAKMAISTLTSMATNILSIGTDPHNPQNIGANVIGILSSFVNLIVYALKNPQFAELMEDELFQQELRLHIMKNLALEHELSEEIMIEA